ncbi:hypothetical protein [Flectobacillus roseus]|uniref:Uncharacterized protein n=1 Tax=Flectobacillus roseus TaxID=502259 RepID=A0ABT6Y359_9BACT|nr:hypothetical protein [Flectobacillus roseus]MDI9857982.1 hypothetical protein [Flectobacillus roseus]
MSAFQDEDESWNYGFISKIIVVVFAFFGIFILLSTLIFDRIKRKRDENKHENVNENILENIQNVAQSHENINQESQGHTIGFVLMKSCEKRDVFLSQVEIDEGILDLVVEENFDKPFEEFENMDVFRLASIIQKDKSIYDELDIDSKHAILELARNYDEN